MRVRWDVPSSGDARRAVPREGELRSLWPQTFLAGPHNDHELLELFGEAAKCCRSEHVFFKH